MREGLVLLLRRAIYEMRGGFLAQPAREERERASREAIDGKTGVIRCAGSASPPQPSPVSSDPGVRSLASLPARGVCNSPVEIHCQRPHIASCRYEI
jgi:hypothetical protein